MNTDQDSSVRRTRREGHLINYDASHVAVVLPFLFSHLRPVTATTATVGSLHGWVIITLLRTWGRDDAYDNHGQALPIDRRRRYIGRGDPIETRARNPSAF